MLNKDENDIIRVAKAELTDDYQVDITNLDPDIFLSESLSADYWAEPSIGFFPERLKIGCEKVYNLDENVFMS